MLLNVARMATEHSYRITEKKWWHCSITDHDALRPSPEVLKATCTAALTLSCIFECRCKGLLQQPNFLTQDLLFNQPTSPHSTSCVNIANPQTFFQPAVSDCKTLFLVVIQPRTRHHITLSTSLSHACARMHAVLNSSQS